jgi:hypothetical protein
MRAFFVDGVDMHQWAVEGLPTLLHLSLSLFFGGLRYFPVQCRSGSLHLRGLVDRASFNGVWIDHSGTIDSTL